MTKFQACLIWKHFDDDKINLKLAENIEGK